MKNTKNMEKEKLINEIADFCDEYGLFSKAVGMDEIKKKIETGLNDFDFVESLINTIIVKTKYLRISKSKNLDVDRLKELLLNLEQMRLDMEYENL